MSHVRCLADNVWDKMGEEEDEEKEKDSEETMETETAVRRPGRSYRNQVSSLIGVLCVGL